MLIIINEEYELHNTLNPKLFENDKLKPEVLDKLREIANEFIESLDPIKLSVADIQFVGSNVSFNYNNQSDIDLHIITDFDLNFIDDEILQSIFNDKKNTFNKKYDFEIYGLPVELYVEDMKSMNATNGIYSILEDKWIKFPKKMDYEVPDYSKELDDAKREVNEILQSENVDEIEKEINKIMLNRKNGLAIDGEMSIGNLVFKELRNLGLIEGLRNKYAELKSAELSLN